MLDSSPFRESRPRQLERLYISLANQLSVSLSISFYFSLLGPPATSSSLADRTPNLLLTLLIPD